jgi:hypothetical protein
MVRQRVSSTSGPGGPGVHSSQLPRPQAADPTGAWAWTTAIPSQGTPKAPASQPWGAAPYSPLSQRKTTLRLKLDGEKLAGTLFTQLSQPRANAVPITDAKLEGDTISSTVTRELNGKRYLRRFSGKISGDTIKGKVEFERDGQPRSAEWVAQRVVEVNQEPPGRGAAAAAPRRVGTNSTAFRRPPRAAP